MANQRLGAVYRGDSCDGNPCNLSSGEADGLAVAVVEHDVLRREFDAQTDDAVPPERGKSPSGEPAEQPPVRHKHVGVARFGPASVLLHTDPDPHLPVDGLSRLQDDACPHRVEARSRLTSGEFDGQRPGVVVCVGAIMGKPLL